MSMVPVFYKHEGDTPTVGTWCGRHRNRIGQVEVIGVNAHKGQTFITFVPVYGRNEASVGTLEAFNEYFPFREARRDVK